MSTLTDEDMRDRILTELATDASRCRDCGQPHVWRVTATKPDGSTLRGTWASDDGHSYFRRFGSEVSDWLLAQRGSTSNPVVP